MMSHPSFFLHVFFQIVVLVNLSNSFLSTDHLGSSSEHLFHFVQVTDIHVTHQGNADRMQQFEEFCNEIIKKLIKPQVTVVSGDLVNSAHIFRSIRILETAQYEEEWKIYRDILSRTNVTRYTKWLDIRGNHDVFMDPDPDSSKSFYHIYTNQGRTHSGSYQYTLRTKNNDSYSFIAIDLCPRPGVGAPFNFYGHITTKEKNKLVDLSEQTKHSTSSIYFGHYPLTFTYASGLKKIMSNGLVYLNGHLHAGIKHLYTRHQDGLLELELGDWKRNRRFRIVTIDSGLLSFGDFRFHQSIYAVISNPKAAKFRTTREPLDRLKESTHIRIVVFSKLLVQSVNVFIDGHHIGSARRAIDNRNLYVLPWNTSLYNDEKPHQILVEIKDIENNTLNVDHAFSFSSSLTIPWNRSQLILSVHQPTFAMTIFILSLIAYILILLFYRYQSKQKPLNCTGRFVLWTRYRLQMTLLCSVDLIYYSLLGLAVYHFIGPWYIGYLTEGYFGATFLWGIIVKGVYLPPNAQILIGTFQLYFLIFPFTYILSSVCLYRYKKVQTDSSLIKFRSSRYCRICTVYVLFVFFFLLILFWSFAMTSSYRLSWILSPFGLTLILYSIFLYIKSHRLTLNDFQLSKTDGNIHSLKADNFKSIEERTMLHTTDSK